MPFIISAILILILLAFGEDKKWALPVGITTFVITILSGCFYIGLAIKYVYEHINITF